MNEKISVCLPDAEKANKVILSMENKDIFYEEIKLYAYIFCYLGLNCNMPDLVA